MNWKSFLIRLLLVVVAFPVFAIVIFGVPQLHHLAFNLAAVAATITGACEMAGMFRARRIPTSTALAPALAGVFPVAAYLEISGALPPGWVGMCVPAAMAVLMVRSVFFTRGRKLSSVLAFTSSSLLTFIYPGFFLSWIVRFSGLPQPSLVILYFLCLVFGNDMLAYFAGSLWGASTRLHFAISPKKSLLGFAAGLLGSLLVVVLFQFAAPSFPNIGVPSKVLLGLGTGLAVIVGDLLESGLKRSAGLKDSGGVIPGRGGLLDSVDSMVIAAPLYYYVLLLCGGG